MIPQLAHKAYFPYECMLWHACTCCATILTVWKTVYHTGKDATMAPASGQLGSAVKMLVQVRMVPEKMVTVDALAATLSEQRYGAAFARAECIRRLAR